MVIVVFMKTEFTKDIDKSMKHLWNNANCIIIFKP